MSCDVAAATWSLYINVVRCLVYFVALQKSITNILISHQFARKVSLNFRRLSVIYLFYFLFEPWSEAAVVTQWRALVPSRSWVRFAPWLLSVEYSCTFLLCLPGFSDYDELPPAVASAKPSKNRFGINIDFNLLRF